jgi:hypothetical protein
VVTGDEQANIRGGATNAGADPLFAKIITISPERISKDPKS